METVFGSDSTASANKAKRGLSVFFSPKSVAVIGATDKPGHVGRAILWNLISSPFGGTVYPVNPKRSAVLGIRAYRSVLEIPERVDLADDPRVRAGRRRRCGDYFSRFS
jgi:acetyltransferase